MTALATTAVPTDGDDFIEVGPGLPRVEIDAGEGDDTILLKPTAELSEFFIYRYAHKNFEFVQGTSADEIVHIHPDVLASLKGFDGGGGKDELVIDLAWVSYTGDKYTLDLSNVDIRNTEIYFENFLLSHWLILKFKDKAAALATKPGSRKAILDFSGTDVVFNLEERNQLFKNGFETIKDASGEYQYWAFGLSNFDKDYQYVRSGDAPVYLDVKRNAFLPYITPGGGSLEVSAPFGTLGLDQSGAIRLVKGADGVLHAMVDLTPDDGLENRVDIGTIAKSSTSWLWVFNFNENATAEGIQEIIRSLTFQLDFPHDRAAYDGLTRITITDAAGVSKDYFNTVYLLPKNVDGLDTSENSAPASDGDDMFLAVPDIFRGDYSLNGGEGTDTLFLGDRYADFDLSVLAEFSGFERIVFHQYGGSLYINAEQLKGVDAISAPEKLYGYSAFICLLGDERSIYNLQGKTFSGNYEMFLVSDYGTIVLNDKSLALSGFNARDVITDDGLAGKRIHLIGDTFNVAERNILRSLGVTDIWDDSDDGAGNAAPIINDLDDEKIITSKGEVVALDVGSNATFRDDVRIRKINVAVTSGNAADALGISMDGFIRLLDGLTEGGEIADTRTGITFANIYDVTNSSFEIMLNANATADRIDLLIRALTYTYGGTAEGWRREILISASDHADKTTTARVVVTDNLPPIEPEPNKAPTDLALSGASILENAAAGTVIGTLSARDGDGDALTYTLTDDAGGRFEIRDGRLVVKAGAVLDYETASSHKITAMVSDGEATVAKDFIIHVGDVLESLTGTRKKDVLKGGIGADRINGGSGNDILTGGDGADQFVFNSALGKGTKASNQNKKVNFDTITDFKPGDDKILLDNAIFKKLGKGSVNSPGALNKKFFKKNKATDKDDYLIYKKGIVYYDADGAGTNYKPIEIIKIANKASLSAADFLII
ncbi:M10 family metallopeptidase C-terminal domain-containing protein [Microvirga flavescens]|uniref:M10 family metallopeptidase C-terminal domain-containing protein n=1 Tax=Microvirga flavescens TaxID=2249811 RepID=UPI000DD5E451|nr:hypothetical protein [Microvirga flavescens]